MKITIIGCGNMGRALAERLSSFHTLFLYDRNINKSETLQNKGYGTACTQIEDALKQSEMIILAIKPHGLNEASHLFNSKFLSDQILISLLAGTPISKLRKIIPMPKIVRMMPNLPLIYGEGIIGLASDEPLSQSVKAQLLEICEPLGMIYWLPENKMNAFTSLAGSGPAFVFAMIESMVVAGTELGFNQQDAELLVRQMLKGSLHLLEKSGKQTDELKKQIASPGGTTIAGLNKFEELAVLKGIINTFIAAYERANEMSS